MSKIEALEKLGFVPAFKGAQGGQGRQVFHVSYSNEAGEIKSLFSRSGGV